MLSNYLLVALRNLKRHAFFSGINIAGLAISMCICIAVIMLVADQMMYDRFNSKGDRIYRVVSIPPEIRQVEADLSHGTATSPLALHDEILNNYPGVEKVVRFKRGFGNNWMEVDGHQNINIPIRGYFADPEVFEVFGYALEHGDAATALREPYTVVLTHESAAKLFPSANPVGKTLKVDQDLYTVTGVLRKTHNKSHISFDGLASMATVVSMHAAGKAGDLNSWGDFWSGWTYLLADEDKQPSDLYRMLDKIYKQHIAGSTDPNQHKMQLTLQPLFKITPSSLMNNAIGPIMPWAIVYFLCALSAIIMITSCFNFTNLCLARALTRAREVGVRKVNGAGRTHILTQFLTESIMVSFISLAIAFIMVLVLKPFMLQLNFARIFRWDLESNLAVYAAFAVFAIGVGLMAGLLPAILISGFQPVRVLKKLGEVKLFSRLTLRRSLIIAQFALSLIFIVTVTLLYNQMALFQTKDHGFQTQNNMTITLNGTSATQLKAALSTINSVEHIAAASHLPATGETRGNGVKHNLSDAEWSPLNYYSVDEDYLKTMSIKLVAGRYFDAANPESNKNFMVINETAVKALNYKGPADVIGQELIWQPDSTRKTVIGVVEDYNHQVLFTKIDAMALMYIPDDFRYLQLTFTGNPSALTKQIAAQWAMVSPDTKADARLLEERIAVFYDTIFGDLVKVVAVVSFLAIFISCMGLMGMATYSTETRLKEIAIRKILGSHDRQIIVLLSKSFLFLLGVAVVVGLPAAWLLNNIWLDMLAYRTPIDLQVMATGVGILMLLGTATVASQTVRAVFINPVDNLRNE